MAFEYHTRRRVEFAETDMAGIAHFSHFFRYMEMAEHDFLRSLGLSVHSAVNGQIVSWPRVRAECSFRAPVTFEDELDVCLVVRQMRTKSITYDIRFVKADGTLAAHGVMTAVCATVEPRSGALKSIPIPAWIREKIEEAPAETVRPSENSTVP